MPLSNHSLLAQFGAGGFQPVASGNIYLDNADQNVGVVNNTVVFISNLLAFLTVLGGIFFIVWFVIAGLQIITAGGDSSKAGKAIEQMRNAILGMVVVVASYAIIGLVSSIIGYDILDLKTQLDRITPI